MDTGDVRNEISFLTDTMNGPFKDVGIILFDYDSTIARIPIDWPQARRDLTSFLTREFPSLKLPEGLRVDEMEHLALQKYPDNASTIFSFRRNLEANTGKHIPIVETTNYIRSVSRITLIVLSNNLRETVVSGLKDLSLRERFNVILGVDDTLAPKPDPAGAQKLSRQFPDIYENSVFVGDSAQTDGEFCQRSGIPFVNIKEKTIEMNYEQ